MTAQPEIPGPNDPGLVALVMLLRFHGIGADPAQIRHQCGTAAIGVADMIRCAREFGLKARQLDGPHAPLRYHLVPGRYPQVPTAIGRGAVRVLLSTALCAGLAAGLSG